MCNFIHYLKLIDRETKEVSYSELTVKDLNIFNIHEFTGIRDKNNRQIYFGDTLRFSDKYVWYSPKYYTEITLGRMTAEQARAEIDTIPYEERTVNSVTDYAWLLSEEIQKYWEVVDEDVLTNTSYPKQLTANLSTPRFNPSELKELAKEMIFQMTGKSMTEDDMCEIQGDSDWQIVMTYFRKLNN